MSPAPPKFNFDEITNMFVIIFMQLERTIRIVRKGGRGEILSVCS